MAIGITVMVMLTWLLLVPSAHRAAPVQLTAPVSALGEYRIPSESIDYIGSYGG
jgi:hypothetical protein